MSGAAHDPNPPAPGEPRGLFANLVASLGLLSAGALAGLLLLVIFLTAAGGALAILFFVWLGSLYG